MGGCNSTRTDDQGKSLLARSPSLAQGRRLSTVRKSNPVWAAAFNEMNKRSQAVATQARQQASLGMKSDELEAWTDAEVGKIRLLSKDLVLSLWNKYDINGDGELSVDELTSLVKDYFTLGAEEIPEELARTLEQQFRDSGMTDEQIIRYMENPEVAEAIQQMRSGVQRRFQVWLADATVFAKRIHAKMDADSDGVLTRDEFVTKFPEACEEVCNVSEVKRTVFRLSLISTEASRKHKSNSVSKPVPAQA